MATTTNGITARPTWPSGSPEMPQATNRQMPTGGVSMPMARLTTMSTPNWIGSTPICGVRAASTGTSRIRAAVVSMMQPMISSPAMTSSSSPHGGSASELMAFCSSIGVCFMAISQVKTLAMAMMKRMVAATIWERMMRPGMSFHLILRLTAMATSRA